MISLSRFKELIHRLQQTNKTTEKVEILKEFPDCQDLLRYTYDPFKRFFVTSSGLEKYDKHDVTPVDYSDLFELLDDLAARKLTGHSALATVKCFMEETNHGSEIIPLILDKNLKTRTDASLINKAFPDLIPQFKVALAKKLDDYLDKMDFENDTWYASRKLDGVRTLCFCSEEGVRFYSREGNEFTTLQKVRKALEQCPHFNGYVLDGEMCIVDENGNEDFKAIVGAIKRKEQQVENPKFIIFDMVSIEEFESQKSAVDLSFRLDTLKEFHKFSVLDHCSNLEDFVSVLDFQKVQNRGHVVELLASADANGWEGMMFRKDCLYEGKRTNNLLKGKKFHDAEYKVLDITTGLFRIANTQTGGEEEFETLTAVVIEHKGNRVQVGSGFSVAQRKEFFEDPSKIIGKVITVQYFEESEDKDGKPSLRFPTLKAIYNAERDI